MPSAVFTEIFVNRHKTSITGGSGIYPIRNEDVRFTFGFSMPVGRPDQLLPIVGEHRKSVESLVKGDLLKSGTVAVDQEQIGIGTARIGVINIGSENNLAAVWMEIRRKICGAVLCELSLVAAVRPHNHDFKFGRHDKIFREQILVLSNFFGCFWPAGTPDNPLAILGMPRPSVVT